MAGLGSVPTSKNNGNELSNRKDDNDKVRNFMASGNRPGLEANRCSGLAEFRLGPWPHLFRLSCAVWLRGSGEVWF
jgi:hypothetical protein